MTVSLFSSAASLKIGTFSVLVVSPSANSTVALKPTKSAGDVAVPAATFNCTLIGPDDPASRCSVIGAMPAFSSTL